MFDPTDPAAYEWPPIVGVVSGGRLIDPETGARFDWPDEAAAPTTEPPGPGWQDVGYIDADAAFAAAPFEVTDLSPYIAQVDNFVQRFICGIDPGDIDIDEVRRVDVIWQIPEPMTIRTRVIDPDLLELIFGQPVIPLCARQIPERGTE